MIKLARKIMSVAIPAVFFAGGGALYGAAMPDKLAEKTDIKVDAEYPERPFFDPIYESILIKDDVLESSATYVNQEDDADDEAENELDDAEEAPFDISVDSAAPTPVNLGGDGVVHMTLQRTGEKIEVLYRRDDGEYDLDAMLEIQHLMRSNLTEEEHPIAIMLVELLDAIEDNFGGSGIIITSGYRSPAFNCRIPGASKNSYHMLGWAADIKLPNHSNKLVSNFARKLGIGGVGYYVSRGFTHVDVGKVRYWVKYPSRRRRWCKVNYKGKSSRYRKSASSKKRSGAKVSAKKAKKSGAKAKSAVKTANKAKTAKNAVKQRAKKSGVSKASKAQKTSAKAVKGVKKSGTAKAAKKTSASKKKK